MYPSKYFVTADRRVVSAADTDQPNSRLTVRTVGGEIAVSIGPWDFSQYGNVPFEVAVDMAQKEAAHLVRTRYEVRRGKMTLEEAKRWLPAKRPWGDRGMSDAMRSALLAVLVHGMPVSAAARKYFGGETRSAQIGERVMRFISEPLLASDIGDDYERGLSEDLQGYSLGAVWDMLGQRACDRRYRHALRRALDRLDPPPPIDERRTQTARRQIQRALKALRGRVADMEQAC